jgi:hypothetical protein
MSLAENHELHAAIASTCPPSLAEEGRQGTRDGAATAAARDTALTPRTRILIEAPITVTLLKLAAPNVLVMIAQASVGLIETYFVGQLGTDALAGVSLVFPAVMLMQMMSAGVMGGGISSAIARALGAGHRADACAGAARAGHRGDFRPRIYGCPIGRRPMALWVMGGSGAALDAALTCSNVVFRGAVLLWIYNSLANAIAAPAIWRCRQLSPARASRC